MSTIVKQKIEDGESTTEIWIEVEEDLQPPAYGRVSYDNMRGKEDPSHFTEAFDKGMAVIRTCAKQVAKTVGTIEEAVRPDAVEVKLGVKLTKEVALIAKVSGEAQMEVTLKWNSK